MGSPESVFDEVVDAALRSEAAARPLDEALVQVREALSERQAELSGDMDVESGGAAIPAENTTAGRQGGEDE